MGDNPERIAGKARSVRYFSIRIGAATSTRSLAAISMPRASKIIAIAAAVRCGGAKAMENAAAADGQAARGEQRARPYKRAKPRKAVVQPMPAAASSTCMWAVSIEAQTRITAAATTAA